MSLSMGGKKHKGKKIKNVGLEPRGKKFRKKKLKLSPSEVVNMTKNKKAKASDSGSGVIKLKRKKSNEDMQQTKPKKRKSLNDLDDLTAVANFSGPKMKKRKSLNDLCKVSPKSGKKKTVSIPEEDVELSKKDYQRYEQLKAAGWTHDISPREPASAPTTQPEMSVRKLNKLTKKEKHMVMKLQKDPTDQSIPVKQKISKRKERKLKGKKLKEILNNGTVPLPGNEKMLKKIGRKIKVLDNENTNEVEFVGESVSKSTFQNQHLNTKSSGNEKQSKKLSKKMRKAQRGGEGVEGMLGILNKVPEERGSKKLKEKRKKEEVHEDELEVIEEKSGVQQRGPKVYQPKKKRFVLFVGQIPHKATEEDIRNHFAKAGPIQSVRLMRDKQTNLSRGICFVEVTNRTSYEIGLGLHHSFLGGRRINVEYTCCRQSNKERAKVKHKNLKLQALHRGGKLHDSKPAKHKRNARRARQRNSAKPA